MYKVLKVVISLVWLLPIGGACLGGLILITGFPSATGAPQEAVVASLACACAIIPYVLARGIAEMINTWIDAFDSKPHRSANGEPAIESVSRSFQGLGLGSKG
jgi:hypothetical protein